MLVQDQHCSNYVTNVWHVQHLFWQFYYSVQLGKSSPQSRRNFPTHMLAAYCRHQTIVNSFIRLTD
jgi:hypothetical protein